MIPPKAMAADFPGRFREILSDPLNLLIARVPEAGLVEAGATGSAGMDCVILHNGNRVPAAGPGAYYGSFSQILVLNRGVHEPLEEYAFQQMLRHLDPAPVMLELGAYWGHYAMWLKRARPAARAVLVEPDPANLAVGRANFARNAMSAEYLQAFVGRGAFGVDAWMAETGTDRLAILHSDIQGHEAEMLEGAAAALAAGRIDYAFVSTHSPALHGTVCTVLSGHGYRIEADADPEQATTSYDGFVLAVHPDRPRVLPAIAPLGRTEIARATPTALVARLAALLAG